MPIADSTELIAFLFADSPIVISKSGNTGLLIKGFASVADVVDIHGDVVDVEGFDVETFMQSPVLLVEHDEHEIAGTPLTMHAAQLVEIGKSDSWGVNDLRTGRQINTYPKTAELSNGTKGLFVTAEVTAKSAIERIKRGELHWLSWRGLANVLKSAIGAASRLITGVDLYEISLVNNPANRLASLVVGKSANLKDQNSIFDDSALLPEWSPDVRPFVQPSGVFEVQKSALDTDFEPDILEGLFPQWLQTNGLPPTC